MSTLVPTALHPFTSEDSHLVAGVIGIAAALAATAVYCALGSKDNEDEFPKLPGIQLYHAWNFFRWRYDFIQSNHERNLGKSFSFDVVHHKFIALTGEEARRIFFSDPHLDASQGVKLFMGSVPQMADVEVEIEETEPDTSLFNKKLIKLLNKARIQNVLPTLLQDVFGEADRWGNVYGSGRIDPFAEIQDLVFLMTARMTICRDLAKNEADLKRLQELFMVLQANATPVSLLLPWLPSPARKARRKATTDFFIMLHDYIEARRRAELTSDAIDVLIANGETTQSIVEFVMGVLFAGTRTTSRISSWVLIHLAIHPQWREKCKDEVQRLIFRHFGDCTTSAMLCEKLAAIPVSAWEDELPVLDACIRESHRLTTISLLMRRSPREMKIEGKVVRRGDFVGYPVGDAHLNPEYYPEPHKYDPGRWLRPDPVPDTTFPFLGWGAGRHPCTGMKVAKLELKLISAIFLTRYEYELVDEHGKFLKQCPVLDRNDIHQSRPVGSTCFFNFRKVAE